METFNPVRDPQPLSQVLTRQFNLGRQSLFSVRSVLALFFILGHTT
jgi:hypothetical protein